MGFRHSVFNVPQDFTGGNPTSALNLANRLVELVPRSSDARFIRAQCEGKLKQIDAAIRDLDTAIELDPTSWGAHFARAGYFANAGDLANAESAYRYAKKAGYPPSLCEFAIGLMWQRAGNFQRAIQAYEEAGKPGGVSHALCNQHIAECRMGQR
jgi:tetratricopeptide (TPR) repeat protein